MHRTCLAACNGRCSFIKRQPLPIKDYTLQKFQQRAIMHIVHRLCLKALFIKNKSHMQVSQHAVFSMHYPTSRYSLHRSSCPNCQLQSHQKGKRVESIPLMLNIMESGVQFHSLVRRSLIRPHIFHSNRIFYGIHFISS